jgi:hypothetical protein
VTWLVRQTKFQLGPMVALIMEQQPTLEEILRALRVTYAKELTNTPDPEARNRAR